MNKYILPIIIIFGLIIIIGYSQINKDNNENKNLTSTTNINPSQIVSVSPSASSSSVPLPKDEDIIKTFFNLINEKNITNAIDMMTPEMIGNEPNKQAWGVHFNNINQIVAKTIEPSIEEEWTQSKKSYKVLLDVTMNPNSANAPIPYYGWNNGENLRWVVIEKINNNWKISSLNTGP